MNHMGNYSFQDWSAYVIQFSLLGMKKVREKGGLICKRQTSNNNSDLYASF